MGLRRPNISLFSDDVAIRAQDSKHHTEEAKLQQGVDAVTTWSKDRRMLLSAQTSEFCIFLMNTHESMWQPTLSLDGKPARHNSALKFLGVTHDRLITSSCHVTLVDNSLKRLERRNTLVDIDEELGEL